MIRGGVARTLLCVSALLVALAACTPDIVFVSDEYLDEVVVDDEFQQRARRLAENREKRIEIVVVGTDAGLLELAEAPCYLFSPILRDVGLQYALETEATIYVFGRPQVEIGSNVATLTFDRTEAFYDAGREAASLVEASDALVGALILADSDARRDERDAFLSGYNEAASGERLRSRAYSREPRREELRSDVRDMLTRGISTLFVALGRQNAFVLDLLAGQDVSVITEDAAATGGFGDLVVFSIERSLASALEATLDACLEGTGETVSVRAQLMRLNEGNDILVEGEKN